MTLDEIVTDYIGHRREGARADMRFFQAQPSIANAISHAVRPGGQKHGHQYRIPIALLDEAECRLQGMTAELDGVGSFAALHRLVRRAIGPIRGIGDLAIYDIAHRLGAFLRLEPRRIYLHCGTRAGAAALGIRGKDIEHRLFPPAFLRLTPAEVEDCLCIYKAEIWGRQSGAMSPARRCLPGEIRVSAQLAASNRR